MLLALIAACTPSTKLDELASVTADLSYAPDENGSVNYPQIVLQLESDACPHLPSISATANGTAVALTQAGGDATGECVPTRFELPDTSDLGGPGLRIEVSDASATWVLDAPDLLAVHGYTLVSPADGVVSVGSAVALAWEPDTDTIAEGSLLARQDDGPLIPLDDVVVAGLDASFTVPSGVTHGELDLGATTTGTPDVEECSGFAACAVSELEPLHDLVLTVE